MDPLSGLARTDKWFLGGGRGAIYAPPFPRFLRTPGFWDECYFADIRIPRLFTVLATRADGSPLRLQGELLDWRPDRLRLRHVADGIELLETRLVTEANAWVSEFEAVGLDETIHLFLWSLPDLAEPGPGTPWQSLGEVHVSPNAIAADWLTAWPAELEPDRTAVEAEHLTEVAGTMLPPVAVHLAWGGSSKRLSWTVNLAQRHDDSPLWETSVLPQKLRVGRLLEDFKFRVGTAPVEGLVHLVQQFELHPGGCCRMACGAGLDPDSAGAALRDALDEGVVERSESAWRSFFASVPQLESSDPHLDAAYWYRWYGLRLNTVAVPGLPIYGRTESFAPFVTEGVGFFRNFVTYSAQAHLREVSWMSDPNLATGILDNLAACQRDDGSYPGHNYSCRPSRDFYHADFGGPVLQLHALHPGSVDRPHLASLRGYADYLLRVRTTSKDPAGPTLFDVFDQNETGQEYMSRYQFASENADQWASFRVHGVDATVYAAELFRCLAAFRAVDSPYRAFEAGALHGLAALSLGPDGFFADVAMDGSRSPARPLTGMYPYMLGSLSELVKHAPKITPTEWEGRFWLNRGFPATAANDPTFSAAGEWKDRRLNCPWNGRSWPMANSHFVDGLANAARHGIAPKELAAEALMQAIKLLFHDGDAGRPCSYEHYDPTTGIPALYRGYDDYMHSWVVDLILRHAVGIRPGEDEVDPLPTGVERIECSNIPHPRGRMRVVLRAGDAPFVEIVPA